MSVSGSSNTSGGGVSGAGAVRAGRAFVEIYGKDMLSRTLDAITKKASAVGATLSRVGAATREAFSEAAGLFGEGFGVVGKALAPTLSRVAAFGSGVAGPFGRAGKVAGSAFATGLRAGLGGVATGVRGLLDPTALVGGYRAVRSAVQAVGSEMRTLRGLAQGAGAGGGAVAGRGGLLAAAGVGAAGGLVGLGTSAVGQTLEMKRLADRVGATTEELSRFAYAARSIGLDSERLDDLFENLPDRVEDARDASSEMAKWFQLLGIDAERFAASGFTSKMEQLADAVSRIPNVTQRNSFLSALGSDKAQGFGPLLARGPAALRELGAESDRLGFTLESRVAKQAEKTNAAFLRLTAAGKGALMGVTSAVLGDGSAVESFAGGLLKGVQVVRLLATANTGLVPTILKVGAGVVAVGAGLVALGLGIKVAAAGVAFALTPFGALVAVTGAWLAFTESGRQATANFGAALGNVWGVAKETWAGLVETFGMAWGGIMDALRKGDLAAAGEVAFKGLELAWQQTLLGLKRSWLEFKESLKQVPTEAQTGTARGITWGLGELRKAGAVYMAGFEALTGRITKEQARTIIDQVEREVDAESRQDTRNINEQAQAERQARRREFEKEVDRETLEIKTQIQKTRAELEAMAARAAAPPTAPNAALALGGGLLGAGVATGAIPADAFASKLGQQIAAVIRGQGPAALPPGVQQSVNQLGTLARDLPASVRGTFSVANARQFFAIGGRVAEKTLVAAESTAANTGRIADAIDAGALTPRFGP